MLFLLSKSLLIVNESDIKKAEKNCCLVYNLKEDSITPDRLQWSPINPKSSGDEANGNDATTKVPLRAVCGCISPSEDYIALCDESKSLLIFNRYFEMIKRYTVKRNFVKMFFVNNEKAIMGCDKSGDIYEFDLSADSNIDKAEKLLLGHCSMLLDFLLTEDDQYIISCDRDEKIRVSHYPNSYNILSYCLGHQEFVSSILLLNKKTLISGSGDGKLILWDFSSGKSLYEFSCDEKVSDSDCFGKEKSRFAIKIITANQVRSHLAVSFYQQPLVYLFKIVCDSQSAFSLELIDKLMLEAEPVRIQFDFAHQDFVWVIGGSSMRPIQLFELKQDKLQKAICSSAVIDSLNESEQLISAITNALQQNSVDGLFKHYYNNVEQYYQRKLQRIEEENKTKRFI